MATGRTLQDVSAMAVWEYQGWASFLSKNPPGDTRLQFLIAQLCALVANAMKDPKKDQPSSPLDFAYWLKDVLTDSDEQKQVAKNKQAILRRRQELIEERKRCQG